MMAALPTSSLSSTDIKSASIVTAEEAEVQEAARLLTGCRSGWLTTAVVDATAALPAGIRIGWGVPNHFFEMDLNDEARSAEEGI